jgi:orotidine-5'-phosphate decarboxylase
VTGIVASMPTIPAVPTMPPVPTTGPSRAPSTIGPGQPFADRAMAAMSEHGPLVFGLDPSGDLLVEWGVGDTADGLERFVDIVVEASVGTVGMVKPQAAFYERHGWQGIRSLARLVDDCRQAGVLVLLDAKRGDVGSTNEAYAEAYLGADAAIAIDAMTITPYLGLAAMQPILDRAMANGAGVFVVTRSSNPEGRAIQGARHPGATTVEHQLVIDIAALNAQVAPGRVGPIGAVFGPTHGPPTEFDLTTMNGLFLAPGVGAQGATPGDVAACFAACPDRVLPAASRSLLSAGPDPSDLRAAAARLAAELQSALGL